jgi:hypothetical protein
MVSMNTLNPNERKWEEDGGPSSSIHQPIHTEALATYRWRPPLGACWPEHSLPRYRRLYWTPAFIPWPIVKARRLETDEVNLVGRFEVVSIAFCVPHRSPFTRASGGERVP